MQKIYTCKDLSLTHSAMVQLRKDGKLNLGINDELTAKLATENKQGPKTSANLAFHFWSWVGFAGLAYTVYLSFADSWWWFIIGLLGTSVIHKANKKGNSENYLDAAMTDPEFYERIRGLNGWLYQVEEEFYEKELSSGNALDS